MNSLENRPKQKDDIVQSFVRHISDAQTVLWGDIFYMDANLRNQYNYQYKILDVTCIVFANIDSPDDKRYYFAPGQDGCECRVQVPTYGVYSTSDDPIGKFTVSDLNPAGVGSGSSSETGSVCIINEKTNEIYDWVTKVGLSVWFPHDCLLRTSASLGDNFKLYADWFFKIQVRRKR